MYTYAYRQAASNPLNSMHIDGGIPPPQVALITHLTNAEQLINVLFWGSFFTTRSS